MNRSVILPPFIKLAATQLKRSGSSEQNKLMKLNNPECGLLIMQIKNVFLSRQFRVKEMD